MQTDHYPRSFVWHSIREKSGFRVRLQTRQEKSKTSCLVLTGSSALSLTLTALITPSTTCIAKRLHLPGPSTPTGPGCVNSRSWMIQTFDPEKLSVCYTKQLSQQNSHNNQYRPLTKAFVSSLFGSPKNVNIDKPTFWDFAQFIMTAPSFTARITTESTPLERRASCFST